jgi:Zn-finger nucleic acid-binding protein
MSENRCCVKCDSILDRGTYAGVEVDLCPRCGGLWLDKGEIERIGQATSAQLEELKRLLLGDPKNRPAASDLTTACPACTGTLKEVVLGPIKVDFCVRCHGVWLDRGELDAGVLATRGKGDLAAILRVAVATTK